MRASTAPLKQQSNYSRLDGLHCTEMNKQNCAQRSVSVSECERASDGDGASLTMLGSLARWRLGILSCSLLLLLVLCVVSRILLLLLLYNRNALSLLLLLVRCRQHDLLLLLVLIGSGFGLFALLLVLLALLGLDTTLGIGLCLGLSHDIDVLARCVSSVVECQTLLDLVAQLLTKDACGSIQERVQARSDRALVGEVARDTALVLGRSTANEGRVEDETVLGSATLCFQGSVA
jgi:hypothetical protein